MLEMDFSAVWLTLKLATLTTAILLVLGTPLAWKLSHTDSWWRGPVNAVVALPFVLPPTVLGFYLLTMMGPNGPVGQFCEWLGLPTLPFRTWRSLSWQLFITEKKPAKDSLSM